MILSTAAHWPGMLLGISIMGAIAKLTGRKSSEGTVTVLGDQSEPIPCRVLSASRSVVRIMVPDQLPKLAELQVQRDEDYFVGPIRSVVSKEGGFLLELAVLGSNYQPLGFGSSLVRVFAGVFSTIAQRLVSVLRYAAVQCLGAKVRPRISTREEPEVRSHSSLFDVVGTVN
jgi:hypothetical protein